MDHEIAEQKGFKITYIQCMITTMHNKKTQQRGSEQQETYLVKRLHTEQENPAERFRLAKKPNS
jgi:hypothetical protein